MKPAKHTLPHLLALIAAMLFAGTGDAHAKKSIPKLYTFGGTTWEIGAVKDPAKHGLSSDAKVGFYGKAFGLFWVNIWTWGAQPALIDATGPRSVTVAQAAELMGTDESKIKTPWTYTFPPGLLIILGLIGLKIVPRIIARRKAAAAQSQQQQKWNGGGSPQQPQQPQQPQPQWSGAMHSPPSVNTPPPMPGAGTPPPVPPPMPPEQ